MSDDSTNVARWAGWKDAQVWCPSCGALIPDAVHRCTVTTTNLLPRRKAGDDR